jgi:hypothetical protein
MLVNLDRQKIFKILERPEIGRLGNLLQGMVIANFGTMIVTERFVVTLAPLSISVIGDRIHGSHLPTVTTMVNVVALSFAE